MLRFHKQQWYFSQIVFCIKAKLTIKFYMENSKKNNIILGYLCIWFQFNQQIEH